MRRYGSGPRGELRVVAQAGMVLAIEVEGGVDHRDVGKSLGEVADEAFELDVVLLGEQAEVVAQGEQAIEEAARVVGAADGFEATDHPETAGEEDAFAGRQAVLDLFGVVAKNEASGHEIALNRFDGAADAVVGGGEKADDGHEQKRRIELFCAVEADEAVELLVEGLMAHFLVDGVANLLPLLDGGFDAELFGDEDGAVKGDPHHHFGPGELFAAAPRFPDAFVGTLPDGLKVVEQKHEDAGVFGGVAIHTVESMEEGVEQFAVDVELDLRGCRVADANGARIFVSGEPVEFPLDELTLAFESVHDLDLVGTAGDGAEQPVLPGDSFFVVAGGGHGEKGEGSVAQPAVAVVPVAHAADGFRQRCGDGGDETAGGTKGHGLEGDKRALDLVGVLALVLEARGPVGPEVLGVAQGVFGADGFGIGPVGSAIREGEPDALALADSEVGDGLEVFAVNGNGAAEEDNCGTRDGANAVGNGVERCNPGNGAAVVEAQGERQVQVHRTANAFDDADKVGN